MKIRIYSFFILTLFSSLATAQTVTENYVMTENMLDANGNSSIKAVQYYNGLGFPTVSAATVGGNGETAYSLTTYDASGREECKYLPVAIGNTIVYKSPNEIIKAYEDKTAYSQNHYDALNRVTSVELPGKEWRNNNKRNKSEFSFNTKEDYVRIYKANPNGQLTMKNTNQYYPAGSLSKEINIDADKKKIVTFRDFMGNVILQRANDGTDNLDTYYVYDEIGRLCYVLSPQYQKTKDKAISGYEYRYDEKGRVYKKKLPGCEIVQYWYDNADRVVCTQDGYMRKKSPSIARFFIYDSMGRMVIRGLCSWWNSNSTFLNTESVVAEFDPKSKGFMGTGYIIPERFERTIKENTVLEIVNYYDGNQALINSSGNDFADNFKELKLTPAVPQIGQLTGAITLASNGEYLAQVREYDIKGNLIKSKSRELNGHIVTNTNSYTFTNNVASSKYDVDTKNVTILSVKDNLEYNVHNNKKQKSTLSINYGGAEVISEMSYAYDDLGRLKTVSRPSSAVNYEYDIHGWLKKIRTNRFVEDLFYADSPDSTYNCYNGNIGTIKWTNSKSDLSQYKYGYKYTYDGANRLTNAIHCQYEDLRGSILYDEKLQYDANGNITRLIRRGQTTRFSGNSSGGIWSIMDNLTISYYGNQLRSVSETVADNNVTGSFEYKKAKGSQYIYNENGSLVADKSRGIAYITYDFNNNPDTIFFTNGSMTTYVYSASGQKLRVVHYTAKPNITRTFGKKPTNLSYTQFYESAIDSTDYLLGGSLVMQNGKIDKFLYEGGYAQVKAATGKFAFYYYNQDHLGNNREVVDARGIIIQTTNYYAFGMTTNDESSPDRQPYKYNGKELDKMHGLNTYDYGARQYDPTLCRWDRMDPLCEKYYSTSPYAYCANNPVMLIDPDGRKLYLKADSNDDYAELLELLQGLTNDQLKLDYKTKEVTILSQNTKNKGKQLKVGTSLIRGVIKSDNKMTIETNHKGIFNEKANGTHGSDGIKTDVTIKIDLDDHSKTFTTQNPKSGKITYKEPINMMIALGHEMVHGYRDMYGISKPNIKYNLLYHGVYFPLGGDSMNERMEELETTGIPYWTVKNWNRSDGLGEKVGRKKISENSLRLEHGLNIRIVY